MECTGKNIGSKIWRGKKKLVSLHSQTTGAVLLEGLVVSKSDHRHIGEAKFKRKENNRVKEDFTLFFVGDQA